MTQVAGYSASRTRAAMQWKTRKRSDGLRLAGPCLDGSAAHPATSAGRTKNAGARAARRPHQPPHALNDAERPARRPRSIMCTLNGGVYRTYQDRPPRRGLSSGRPILLLLQAEIRVRAGPKNRNAAPSGAGRKACGTERIISSAPLHGALRGVPAEGVAGDSEAAPAQGKAFPKRPKI